MTPMATTLRAPLVTGPMAGAAGGALAAAVSKGGGLGFMGAGYYNLQKLHEEVAQARAVFPSGRLPIGIGFLTWRLTKLGQSDARALVDAAIESAPAALWFSYGAKGESESWCSYAKQKDASLELYVTANTLQEARDAEQNKDIDVIVVQGHEAGGHGLGRAPPRDVLLKEVLGSRTSQDKRVLSAGGLADGNDIAAQLALGADGVVLGTRFLLTPEAAYLDDQKQLLVRAGSQDTVRSMAFDDARGTIGWPEGIDGRGLRCATVDEYEQAAAAHPGLATVPGIEARQERYRQAQTNGETERLVTWSGTGVGAMHDIVPAAELVERLAHDARTALHRAAARCGARTP